MEGMLFARHWARFWEISFAFVKFTVESALCIFEIIQESFCDFIICI